MLWHCRLSPNKQFQRQTRILSATTLLTMKNGNRNAHGNSPPVPNAAGGAPNLQAHRTTAAFPTGNQTDGGRRSYPAQRGDKRRRARGSARSRAVPRDTSRRGGKEGSAGSAGSAARPPRVLCHGPLSEAFPAASPLTSPHPARPARSPEAPRSGPATYPQAAARRPHAARARRRSLPSAPPERAPRARHRARRRAAPPPQAPSPYAIPARRWGGAGGTRKWRRPAPPRALGPGTVRVADPRSRSAAAGTWGRWVCSALPVGGCRLRYPQLRRAA